MAAARFGRPRISPLWQPFGASNGLAPTDPAIAPPTTPRRPPEPTPAPAPTVLWDADVAESPILISKLSLSSRLFRSRTTARSAPGVPPEKSPNRRCSADWQSAVSPIGNRPTLGEPEAGCRLPVGATRLAVMRVELLDSSIPAFDACLADSAFAEGLLRTEAEGQDVFAIARVSSYQWEHTSLARKRGLT